MSELFHACYTLADSFLGILQFYNGSARYGGYKLCDGHTVCEISPLLGALSRKVATHLRHKIPLVNLL